MIHIYIYISIHDQGLSVVCVFHLSFLKLYSYKFNELLKPQKLQLNIFAYWHSTESSDYLLLMREIYQASVHVTEREVNFDILRTTNELISVYLGYRDHLCLLNLSFMHKLNQLFCFIVQLVNLSVTKVYSLFILFMHLQISCIFSDRISSATIWQTLKLVY